MMDPSNPESWRAPADWHPDLDATWQIARLRELATGVREGQADVSVHLDLSEPVAICVLVERGGAVLAAAFVNRRAAGSEEADFPIYVGPTEHHATTLRDAVDTLVPVAVPTG